MIRDAITDEEYAFKVSYYGGQTHDEACRQLGLDPRKYKFAVARRTRREQVEA